MNPIKGKILVAYAILSLCISVTFVGMHLRYPSDGARLVRGNTPFTAQGVVMSPYPGASSLLRNGDILVAVQGISIQERARMFFSPVAPGPAWRDGNVLEYSLIRDGKEIKINVPMAHLPLRAILAENWGLLIFMLLTQSIAIFVYSQKPSDPPAQAFFIWSFSASHIYSWSFFLQANDLIYGTGFWVFRLAGTGLLLIFWVAALHMLLIFPRALLSPTSIYKVLILLYVSPFILLGIFVGAAWLNAPDDLTWWNSWSNAEFIISSIYTIPAIVLMFVHQRTVRSEAEKKKARLLIYGGLFSTVLGMSLHFLPELFFKRSFLDPNGLGLINLPFIIGIAIAIWRYHLFDIDLIIRRTLVYSLLTGILSGVYFGGVALLQGILTADSRLPTAGQSAVGGPLSAVVIVATTLTIAALFNPLRRRLQETIDRRFYRQKYDAEKALAEFAAAARSEMDFEMLTGRLANVAQETLQPFHISLWMQNLDRSINKEIGKS